MSVFDLELETAAAALRGEPGAQTTLKSIVIVTLCSLTLFINNGFMLIGKSVFDPMMLHRLGVATGVLKAGDTILYLTVAFASPLAGYVMDKFGPRVLFGAGFTLMAAGLALYAGASSILMVYAVHAMFGLSLVCSGSYACVIVASQATDRRRGLAIGILLAAASLGTGVAPGAYSIIAALIGWQNALRLVAVVTACMLPAIFALPARRTQRTAPATGHRDNATLAAAVRSSNFWLLSLIAGVGFVVAIGLSSNMVLFLTNDIRLKPARIDVLLLVMSIAGLSAQLLTGALSDMINRRVIHTGSILVMAAGCLMFHAHAEWIVWIAGLCFAVGWGGHYVLLQSLLPTLFAGPSFGRIVGVIALVEALVGSAGPSIVGASFDLTASYRVAFEFGAIALVLTAALAAKINARSR